MKTIESLKEEIEIHKKIKYYKKLTLVILYHKGAFKVIDNFERPNYSHQ